MSKMKKLVCLMMALVLAVGMLAVGANAGGGSPVYVDENYIVSPIADPVTSNDRSFKSSADVDSDGYKDDDGKVWADKSVTLNADGTATVTLSSMAQEFFTADDFDKLRKLNAADVLFILDVTQSMNESLGSTTRRGAMVEALNKAMTVIMKANPYNRIMVSCYGGSTQTFLPLAIYTSTTTVGTGSSAYTQYVYLDGTTIKTDSNLKKNGSSYNNTRALISYTYTQMGVIESSQNFISAMQTADATGATGRRAPFVLLLTDGVANGGKSSWQVESYTGSDIGSSNTALIAAYTALSSIYQKMLITNAYNTRNQGVNSEAESVTTYWMNIGVGSSLGNDFKAMLKTDSMNSYSSSVYNTVNSEVTSYNSAHSGANLKVDYSEYSAIVTAVDTLQTAFDTLAQKIRELTAVESIVPITKKTTGSTDDVFVTFTDTLGDGTTLVKDSGNNYNITISYNGTTYTGEPESTGSTTYVFKNGSETLKSKATVTASKVVWAINSAELPLVKFSDRNNPTTGNYSSATVTPISMSYGVKVTDTAALSANLDIYSNKWSSGNGTTTASFTPKVGNPYYYDGTSKKTASTAPVVANATVSKSTNKTGTAANVSVGTWNSDEYVIYLGNNAKFDKVSIVSITANPASVFVGEDTVYTIELKNDGDAAAVVSVSAVLDSALTYKSSAVNSTVASPSVSSNTYTWSDVSIPANATTFVTMTATGNTAKTTTSTTASFSYNGKTANAPAAAEVEIKALETATVKTYLNDSLTDTDGISGAPAALYLSADGTTFTALTKDSTGTYKASVVPGKTYYVYDGNSGTPNKVNNVSIAVTAGGTNETSIYWVLPKVITKLDGSNKDIGDILSGATTLYLGAGRTTVINTADGTYVSATPVFAPAAGTDYYIYTTTAEAADIGKVAVSAGGKNEVTLEWYTVDFVTDHGSKPADQIVKKGGTATTPGALTDTYYNFLDWYKEAAHTNKFSFADAINAKTTVYADWQKKADVPVKYPEYIPNEMPENTPTDMTVPYNYTIIVKPNVHGTYNSVYTDTSFSATDNVNGYTIADAVADTNWVFVGYTMAKDDVAQTVTYTAQYLPDNVGNGPGSDGIPDAFQKPVTYKIENGTWGGTETADITEYVNLYNAEGRLASRGSGTLAKTPTNMQGNAGYTQNPGKWYDTNGQEITVPAGYTDTDTTPVTYIYKYTTLDTVNLTFNEYIKYNQESYKPGAVYGMTYGKTVTIDKKGGTYADNSLDMTENKTVGDPTKEGYTFLGWKIAIGSDGNATLTAMWRYNGGYIKYPINNPSPTPDDLFITSGHKLTVYPEDGGTYDEGNHYVVTIDGEESVSKWLANSLTKTGYVFVGWEVTEDETESVPNGDYTAIARYEEDTVGEKGEQSDGVPDKYQKRLNYIIQNGTWDSGYDSYLEDGVANFTIDGAGVWNYTDTLRYEYATLLDADGNWSIDGSAHPNVPDADQYANPDTAHKRDDSAGWTTSIPGTVYGTNEETFYYNFPSPSEYAIVYNANSPDGVTEKAGDTKIHGVDLNLAGASRTGYTFRGWSKSYTAAVGEGIEVYTENAPTTLFAIWQINSYPLTFEGPNGPVEKPIDYNCKLTVDPNGGKYNNTTEKTVTNMPASAKDIADPVWEGYTFTGWTVTDPDGDGGVTLTANWQKDKVVKYNSFIDENPEDNVPDREPEEDQVIIPYKKILHIDPNGGTYNGTGNITDVPVVEDMTVGDPIAPEKKVFVGWEVTGPAEDGSFTLKAHYEDDINEDDIPDCFQNHVTYKVVNGTWSDDTTADLDDWVTLRDENGKLSTTGTGTATFPVDMKPAEDHIAEGAAWSPSSNVVTGSKPAAVFTYTFLEAGQRTVTFDKYVSDTELPVEDQVTITKETKTVTIVPNGGKYLGTKNNTVYEGLTSNLEIGEPEAPEGKIFMGWKETSDEKGNLIYIAQYVDDVVGDPNDPDHKGDGIPDCFQKRVAFYVLNGTWDGEDADVKVTYVTLFKDGKWNAKGTGKVDFPIGMQPDMYHEDDGAWENRPENDTVSGTDPVSFTYRFDTLKKVNINYNRNVDSDSKTPDVEITVLGKTLIIDPNGGKFEGTTRQTVRSQLGLDLDVDDADAPENMIFVGWRLEQQDENTLIMTAIYKEVKPVAPKTADTARTGLWAALTVAFGVTAGAALTITRKKYSK